MRNLLLLVLVVIPLGVLAAPPENFVDFLSVLNGIVGLLIPIVFALTFLTILWGIVKAWIFHSDDTSSVESGKRLVIVGILVLVVMTSIWGIVRMLQSGLFE